jgi:hypothetical protein
MSSRTRSVPAYAAVLLAVLALGGCGAVPSTDEAGQSTDGFLSEPDHHVAGNSSLNTGTTSGFDDGTFVTSGH